MKKSLFLSKKAGWTFMISCLSMVVLLTSCLKEPKPEPVGEAEVKFVNAVEDAEPQDFYVNGAKKNTTALAYGQSSAYVTITSGGNEFVFTDQDVTTELNAIVSGGVAIGSNTTLFYVKSLDNEKRVLATSDDMTAPASGKAKVRFIHVNHFLNNSLAVAVEGGSQLLSGLAFGEDSNYYPVDPGTKFVLSATGVSTSPVLDAGIVAGKNYTIWIDGADATKLEGHVLVQN